MTLLYLVRHGETEWSRSGRHTSVTDLDLTDHGVEQARSLDSRLDQHDFGLVLASPRLRAQRTAALAGCDGGESADDVRARLTRVVARVRASGVDRAICFGHGHALRVLALAWLDFPVIFGQSFPLDVASVSILGREKESPAVLRWNS